MELNEAEKILKDEGYEIKYTDLEDTAVNKTEDLVTLANVLADVVPYFSNSNGKFNIVKVEAYGFTVENSETKNLVKIYFLQSQFTDEPKIMVSIVKDGRLLDGVIVLAGKTSAKDIFNFVNKKS
jgi:hypothetical protein